MSKVSTTERILIEQQVMSRSKDVGTAYALLVVLGLLGAHNFYLGRIGPAIAQALLTISMIGMPVSLIWIIIDAFTIPKVISDKNETIRNELTTGSMGMGDSKADIEATVMLQELKSQQSKSRGPIQYALAAGIAVVFVSIAFKTITAPDPTPDEQAMLDEIKSLKGQVRALKNRGKINRTNGGGLMNLQQEKAAIALICGGPLTDFISYNADAWLAAQPLLSSVGGVELTNSINYAVGQSRQLESSLLTACRAVPAGLK